MTNTRIVLYRIVLINFELIVVCHGIMILGGLVSRHISEADDVSTVRYSRLITTIRRLMYNESKNKRLLYFMSQNRNVLSLYGVQGPIHNLDSYIYLGSYVTACGIFWLVEILDLVTSTALQ